MKVLIHKGYFNHENVRAHIREALQRIGKWDENADDSDQKTDMVGEQVYSFHYMKANELTDKLPHTVFDWMDEIIDGRHCDNLHLRFFSLRSGSYSFFYVYNGKGFELILNGNTTIYKRHNFKEVINQLPDIKTAVEI